MKRSPILEAIDQICAEKHISRESVLETIEAALAVAYRKDFADKKNQNIQAEFNPETAAARIFDVKEVVEDELYEEYLKQKEELEKQRALEEASGAPPTTATEGKPEQNRTAGDEGAVHGELSGSEEEKKRRFDPKSMIPLAEAAATNPGATIGTQIKTELFPPEEYGRMAAQTAKQVIIQRLREAERETTFREYKEKVGEILTGTVQRIEGRVVLIDLGHATAIMPPAEQIERERYLPGQRIKVYLVSVTSTSRGPEIVVSRAHPDMVKKLFSLEVPEVASSAISIMAIAREAGSRTKIAVHTTEPNIDPVGSCVGQRGTRVQTIIAEIGGEKIDIIQYEEDPVRFIINALSPAKVLSVKLMSEEKRAIAEVKEDQLSLAIGRAGQNVRLAAKLTTWKIDIVKEGLEGIAIQEKKEREKTNGEPKADETPTPDSGETKAEAPVEIIPTEPSAQPDSGATSTPSTNPTVTVPEAETDTTSQDAPLPERSDQPKTE